MNKYKELLAELRFKECVIRDKSYTDLISKTADALEELLNEYKELIKKCADMENALDTELEYGNELKRKLYKINSLTPNGYYTGTYIQSLIESEERSSDWKDEESVTFFPANKEIEE